MNNCIHLNYYIGPNFSVPGKFIVPYVEDLSQVLDQLVNIDDKVMNAC